MEKILVVEDDESIRNLIKLTLEQFQYEVQAFEDAESAWKYLQDDTADVGIFDLMLPGMSGLDLIAKIRKDEQLQDFPVIILTAKDSEIDYMYDKNLFYIRESIANFKSTGEVQNIYVFNIKSIENNMVVIQLSYMIFQVVIKF